MKDKELLKIVQNEVENLSSLLKVESEKEVSIEEGEEGVKYLKVNFEEKSWDI